VKPQEIQQLHRDVWAARRALAAIWPLPPADDCARFAITELGEVFDALLRADPHYVRNHRKDYDLGHELAQLGMMALLVYPGDFPEFNRGFSDMIVDVQADLAETVASLLRCQQEGLHHSLTLSIGLTLELLERLAVQHDIHNLPELIRQVARQAPA